VSFCLNTRQPLIVCLDCHLVFMVFLIKMGPPITYIRAVSAHLERSRCLKIAHVIEFDERLDESAGSDEAMQVCLCLHNSYSCWWAGMLMRPNHTNPLYLANNTLADTGHDGFFWLNKHIIVHFSLRPLKPLSVLFCGLSFTPWINGF
jgi:hypothetical protein